MSVVRKYVRRLLLLARSSPPSRLVNIVNEQCRRPAARLAASNSAMAASQHQRQQTTPYAGRRNGKPRRTSNIAGGDVLGDDARIRWKWVMRDDMYL